ncbi:MAG: AEC family transporter [Eubacteriales bacterium]|nr:AEC family transporter [Eubacteriales bacterium]
MITVFIKVISIFLMIGVGYLACKTGALPQESNKYLVNLLLDITTPFMVIAAFATQEMNPDKAMQTRQVFIGTLIFFAAEFLISYIVMRLLRYEPASDRGVLMCIMTAVNNGFMGFPISKAVFGNEYFFLMVISNVVLKFYLYSGAIWQMNYGHAKSHQTLRDLLHPLMNNAIYATVIGLVILIAGIKLPEPIISFSSMIGDATVPVSMIVVGISLANADLRKLLKDRKLMITCLANVLLMPLLTLAVVYRLPLPDPVKLILVLNAALPCSVVCVAVAKKEGRNSELLAAGTTITTFFSVFTLPAFSILLTKLFI